MIKAAHMVVRHREFAIFGPISHIHEGLGCYQQKVSLLIILPIYIYFVELFCQHKCQMLSLMLKLK